MLDLIVHGGTVVVPEGPTTVDIGIKGDKIAVIGSPGDLPEASQSLNVEGMVVVPGGIDPHVHCSLAIHNPDGTSSLSAGPDVMSYAALHGGTTTLIDFVWPEPEETLAQATDSLVEQWENESYSDFSFHIVLRGEISESQLAEIPERIGSGFPSFKVFTTNVFPHSPIGGVPLKVEYGSLKEVFDIVKDKGGIVAVHAEDEDLVQHNYRRMFAENKTHFRYMPDVHSSLSEDLAFRRVIRLAEKTGGAPIYFVHTSAATGVDAIAEARAKGQPVFGETLHQYALHTQDDYLEPDGMKYHTYPSIKTAADTERLWNGVEEGVIHTFATDGQITSYKEKTTADQIDNVTGGNAGVEPRMPVLYSEIVDKRKLGLKLFAEVTSTNAAKILGLYPRKGAIAVGSDADLAVFDPEDHRVISNEFLHESDYTPWDGWEVSAWPFATILRGHVVVKSGEFLGQQGMGGLVPRASALVDIS